MRKTNSLMNTMSSCSKGNFLRVLDTGTFYAHKTFMTYKLYKREKNIFFLKIFLK